MGPSYDRALAQSDDGVKTPFYKQVTRSDRGLGPSTCIFACRDEPGFKTVLDPTTEGSGNTMDYMCYQCPTGSCTCSSPNDFLDLVNKPSTGDGFNGFITECKQCPENRASLDQAGLTATSCHCDATSFESSGECTDCPDSESGSLALPYPNLADELSDCWCPAGKTLGSLTTGGSCDPCPYGKICPSPRVKFDKGKREFDCPSDSTMLSGSVSQTTARACAPDTKEGTYLLLNATDPDLSEVRNCPAMTNQNMRYRSHDDNPDFFATTAAVTSAPVGVQTTGVCRTECAEGFILGANGCECEAPKLSVPGEEGCFCPQGQYEDVATGTCVQCPENFFCPSPEVKASLGSSKIACPSSDDGLVYSFSAAGSPSASYCMPGSPGYYVWKQRPQKLYHCPDLTDPTTAFSDFNTQQNNPVSGDYVWDNENALTPADVSYDQLNQYPSASNDRLCAIECGDGYEQHQGQQLGSGNFLCQCSGNTRIKGDDDAQCECKARYFGTDLQATGGQCQQCPENKYCTGGSHQADCETGTFSGPGQAGSAEECGCAPGYYNENADTPGALRSCKQCAKGTLCPGGQRFETCEAGVYCPLIGGKPGQTGAKVACPPGSTSPAGSTQEEDCQPCSAGTFCEGGAALRNCTNDDSQKAFVTSKTSATSISDCECKPGYYGAVTAQAATCQQCPVGSFCPGGASFTLCANGTTGDTQGATSQEECRACPANYKCVNGGQEACFKDGVVAEKDLDTAAGAGTACFCKAGFYGAPPDVACEPCAAPFFCPAGNNLIAKACPAGKVTAMAQATFASDCQCKPGKYPVGDGCDDCPVDYYCSGPAAPVGCPTGTFSPAGANARTELECRCPAGQYADPSSTSSLQCLQCKPGFFCRDGGITACPTGKTSEQGSDSADDCACRAGYTVFGSECLSCPPGQFCVQGVSAGTKCPANTYSMLPRNAPNSLSCAQCPAESAGSPAGSAGIESCGVSRVAVKEQSATVLGLPYKPASGEDISLPAVLGTFSVSVSSGVTAQAAATALRDAAKAVLGGTGSYLPGPGVGRVGAPMFAQVYVTERTVARRRALLQDSAVDLSMDIRVRLSSGFVDGTKVHTRGPPAVPYAPPHGGTWNE